MPHLPIISAMEIPFRYANVRMAHQRLDRPEIIPSIQQSRGRCVSFFTTDLMKQSTDLCVIILRGYLFLLWIEPSGVTYCKIWVAGRSGRT